MQHHELVFACLSAFDREQRRQELLHHLRQVESALATEPHKEFQEALVVELVDD